MAGASATIGLATLGLVGGPWGALVGGVIGAGIDIFNWFTGEQAKTSQDKLQHASDIATAQATLSEDTTKKSAYEDFLAKVPVAGQSLSGTTGDIEFDTQYRQLLQNYGDVNVMAGVTGRVGGAGTTGQALGQQASDIMGGFVEASKQKAQQQVDIYNTGIDSLNTGIAAIQDVQEHPDIGTQIVTGVEDFFKGMGNWFSGKGWVA